MKKVIRMNKMNKKAQERKFLCIRAKPKLAQEEIVGFAVIMILVAIILVILLGLYLNNNDGEALEDFQLTNFVNVITEINTECSSYRYPGGLPIEELVSECALKRDCLEGDTACDILEKTIKEVMNEAWPVGPDWPQKGYELKLIEDDEEILILSKGNTNSSVYKTYTGSLGIDSNIDLKIYL